MTDPNADDWKIFMQLHEGLPRQSCGSVTSTTRALNAVRHLLPDPARVADLGCGPGSSLLPLAAELPTAKFIAADLLPSFIEDLQTRADAADIAHRVAASVADMMAPPAKPNSLDMIWSEGAIYNVGVQSALHCWAEYLKPEGIVVFNEVIWLTPESERPAELVEFWSEYPGMTNDTGVSRAIYDAGFRIVESFDMQESDWWDEYYTPLEARLSLLSETYPDAAALALTRTEIDMRRKYAAHYNYRFFCCTRNA